METTQSAMVATSYVAVLKTTARNVSVNTKERDGKSVSSWCDGSSDRCFMVDPLTYFSFQPVLHDCCNKGCGMYY